MAPSQLSPLNSGKLGSPPFSSLCHSCGPPPPPTIRPDQGRCYSCKKRVLHCESSFVTFISTEGSAGWKQRTYSLFQQILSPHTSSLLVLLPHPPTRTPTSHPQFLLPHPPLPLTTSHIPGTMAHNMEHLPIIYLEPASKLDPTHHSYLFYSKFTFFAILADLKTLLYHLIFNLLYMFSYL